jgi:hypothetical protein
MNLANANTKNVSAYLAQDKLSVWEEDYSVTPLYYYIEEEGIVLTRREMNMYNTDWQELRNLANRRKAFKRRIV